jgi:hypothetical protein
MLESYIKYTKYLINWINTILCETFLVSNDRKSDIIHEIKYAKLKWYYLKLKNKNQIIGTIILLLQWRFFFRI